MKSHVRVAVIGGGVVGCSVLYHLTKLGWREVVLLEAGEVPYDSNDPGRQADIRRMNELRRERLAAARQELEQARRELSDIEESAQRDGVPPGQLR